MDSMFYGCTLLSVVSPIDLVNVKTTDRMLYGCVSLKSIPWYKSHNTFTGSWWNQLVWGKQLCS